MNITTTGDHCAALATDRGGGNISVDTATLSTAGQGSPLIYSTGVIEVNNATGESTGSQIVGMEGLNTVRIKNSTLTGSSKKASEPVANGVILYQSTSGDSSTGEANFEASDSTLKSYVSGGAMFYVTNTDANIVLKNNTLDFDSDNNTLLTVAGNDGSNGWGSAGSNGGTVTLTGISQTLQSQQLLTVQRILHQKPERSVPFQSTVQVLAVLLQQQEQTALLTATAHRHQTALHQAQRTLLQMHQLQAHQAAQVLQQAK